MARTIAFKKDDILINQGNEDTTAYLIQSGWLKICRDSQQQDHAAIKLGPGKIAGELGLAGVVPTRTASVVALTDGTAEIIDRGALIRMVNSPGNRMTPLLAALFSRLQSTMKHGNDEQISLSIEAAKTYATLRGKNPIARRALCDQPCVVTHLPWVFGAYKQPQSVTDLFQHDEHVDVILAENCHTILKQHILLCETKNHDGLQLQCLRHGSFCEVDDELMIRDIIHMPHGRHTLTFGDPAYPYQFSIHIPVNPRDHHDA